MWRSMLDGGGVLLFEKDEEGVDPWKFFPLSRYNRFIY